MRSGLYVQGQTDQREAGPTSQAKDGGRDRTFRYIKLKNSDYIVSFIRMYKIFSSERRSIRFIEQEERHLSYLFNKLIPATTVTLTFVKGKVRLTAGYGKSVCRYFNRLVPQFFSVIFFFQLLYRFSD